MITPSQQSVIDQILRIWATSKNYPAGIAGIQPRAVPLIAGRSGTGKSTIPKRLSQILHCPLFSISAGSWILRCANERSGIPTLCLLEEFIETNGKGIIFLDELDKFTAETDWMRAVQQELYALIDLDSARLNWSNYYSDAIKGSFCFLCAGTWQDLKPPRALGFKSETSAPLNLLEHQRSIPEELLRRTSHPPLLLPNTSHQEFLAALTDIHIEFGDQTNIDELASIAVASCLIFRWLENYVASLLSQKDLEPPKLTLDPYPPPRTAKEQPHPAPAVPSYSPEEAAVTAVRARLSHLEHELMIAKETSSSPTALNDLDTIEERLSKANKLIQELRTDLISLVPDDTTT